jgi:hypothetical protein
MPPWLPPNVRGGYWHQEYEQTAEERRADQRAAQVSARLDRERANAIAEASRALTQALTPDAIGRLVANATDSKWARNAFDEASCSSAWRVLATCGEYPATHTLVKWKARHREWGFYFKWLPDHVVRQVRGSLSPLWKLPTRDSWVDADGKLYRIVGTSPVARVPVRPDVESGLLNISSQYYGLAVVPRGERLRTEHRLSPSLSRSEHYIKDGFHVELAELPRGLARIDASDLALFLSRPVDDDRAR